MALPEPAALDDLADVLHSREGGYYDPETGWAYRELDGDLLDDDGAGASDDWLDVRGEFSHLAYEDMERFAEAIADPGLRARLLEAIRGRGAFRRFRDVVHNTPAELGRTWNRYRQAQQEIRALRWLEREGLAEPAEVAGAVTERETALAAIGQELAKDPRIDAVVALERELQSPECRRDRARLEELLDQDFHEVGASGRLWARETIIEALLAEEETSCRIRMEDVGACALSGDVVLVSWTSVSGARRARRSSIWRYDGASWRLRHHQGTPLPGEPVPGPGLTPGR